jgi:indole-3-acetate monooxygenase
VSQAWETAVAGGVIDVAARGRMRLAGAHAAEAAVLAANTAYTLGGGTSIFESSPLQRCLRDAHVVTQHIMVAPRLYETLGKLHFGIDIDASMI